MNVQKVRTKIAYNELVHFKVVDHSFQIMSGQNNRNDNIDFQYTINANRKICINILSKLGSAIIKFQ